MSVQDTKEDGVRMEHDTLGAVAVPSTALWGAQTQRSLQHFRIGADRFNGRFIRAFALVKKAAAQSNLALGGLDASRCALIVQVCDEILAGRHDDQFPLSVWQTGSGTQTNMNLNEVIANRGNELAGGHRGAHGAAGGHGADRPGAAGQRQTAALLHTRHRADCRPSWLQTG